MKFPSVGAFIAALHLQAAWFGPPPLSTWPCDGIAHLAEGVGRGRGVEYT